MSITRPRHKVDGNQHEIVDALFSAGCTVQTLAVVGGGCPDLLVAKTDMGGFTSMWLMEVKMPGEALNEFQKKWHKTWAGPVFVVTSAAEAVGLVTR